MSDGSEDESLSFAIKYQVNHRFAIILMNRLLRTILARPRFLDKVAKQKLHFLHQMMKELDNSKPDVPPLKRKRYIPSSYFSDDEEEINEVQE